MKKLFTFSVFFLLLQSVFAQNTVMQPSIGGGVSKGESEKIMQMFQYQAKFYSQFAPLKDTLQTKIIIFENPHELKGYLSFRDKKSKIPNTTGTFLASRRELLIARTPRDREILPGAAWQISNYFIYLALPNIHKANSPSHWIQTGLNGLFKHTTLKNSGAKHKKPNYDARERMKTALNRGEVNLKEFIGLKKSEIYKLQNGNHYAYALAHSLAYFLMENHKELFIKMIKQAEDGTDTYETINELYSGGFEQFEKDFFDFYKIK